jgi:hypothetical protein
MLRAISFHRCLPEPEAIEGVDQKCVLTRADCHVVGAVALKPKTGIGGCFAIVD